MMKLFRNKTLLLIVILSGIGIVFNACDNPPKGIMTEKEMVNFLTDLHKLDGSLHVSGLGYVQNKVNILYYNSLLDKHHITEAVFDSSLVYYTENPRKFEHIYDLVIINLKALSKEVNSHKFHPIDSLALRSMTMNMWNKKVKFVITKDSVQNQIKFSYRNPLYRWKDKYILSFIERVAPLDSAKINNVVMKINYTGGVVDSIVAKAYDDSVARRYHLVFKARIEKRIDSITGSILSFNDSCRVNAEVDSIRLIRKYDALAQDSIIKAVNKLEIKNKSKKNKKDTIK